MWKESVDSPLYIWSDIISVLSAARKPATKLGWTRPHKADGVAKNTYVSRSMPCGGPSIGYYLYNSPVSINMQVVQVPNLWVWYLIASIIRNELCVVIQTNLVGNAISGLVCSFILFNMNAFRFPLYLYIGSYYARIVVVIVASLPYDSRIISIPFLLTCFGLVGGLPI